MIPVDIRRYDKENNYIGNLSLPLFIDVNKKVDDLNKEAERIQEEVNKYEDKLKELSKQDNELLKGLHEKYGNFTLQDIRDTVESMNN